MKTKTTKSDKPKSNSLVGRTALIEKLVKTGKKDAEILATVKAEFPGSSKGRVLAIAKRKRRGKKGEPGRSITPKTR